MAATADEYELDVDSVTERLLGGKHEVQLRSDEGTAGQPMLLEFEAPFKICGEG